MKLLLLCACASVSALRSGTLLDRALTSRRAALHRGAALTAGAAAALIPAATLAEVAYERDADGKMVKVERKSYLDKLAYKPGSPVPGLGEFLGAAVEGKELGTVQAEPPTQQPPTSSKLGVNLFLAAAVGGAVFVGTRGPDGEQAAAPPAASPPEDETPIDVIDGDSDTTETPKEG